MKEKTNEKVDLINNIIYSKWQNYEINEKIKIVGKKTYKNK